MKIKVDRVEFLKALKTVDKSISDNKIRPIISCVYLEAQGDNKLVIKGTNLELTVITEVLCDVIESGIAVFPPMLVEEYLKEITDTSVSFEVVDNVLVIESSDSSSEVVVMDPTDYPVVKVGEVDGSKEIDKNTLLSLLDKTKFAASGTSDNLAMNCVRLEGREGKLKVVATDTFRLVYLEEELEGVEDIGISIPLNTVDVLVKLLKGVEEEKISFKATENQLIVSFGETIILSRLISLDFPNYEAILTRSSFDKKIEVDVEKFEKILKRVQIFVKNNNESKFSSIFTLFQDKLYIYGSSEVAKIKEDIDVEYSGEELKISLNVKFLLDYIQYLNSKDKLEISLLDASSAILLRSKSDENYKYIAMPLALRD